MPAGHRFPLGKYALLRERAALEPRLEVDDARAATRAELLLAHSADWVERAERGKLTRDELRALGLPWSPSLVERARRSVGATLEASAAALADGTGANLGGGTHHAFPDSGRGFCLFNDVVTATRALRASARLQRVLVVDLDVHQGDGTHAALAGDDEAFTFSLNGLGNYPFRRVAGDLERDLPGGTGDDAYLDALAELLPVAIDRSRAELCFYVAGADPFEGDRLGRLALTHAGLADSRQAGALLPAARRHTRRRDARGRLRGAHRGHRRDQSRDIARVRVTNATSPGRCRAQSAGSPACSIS